MIIVRILIILKLHTIIQHGQKLLINKQLLASEFYFNAFKNVIATLFYRSWEILTFSPRIVVFIRIVGTRNTANEVFHCVHFECPCRPDVLKAYMNEQNSMLTTDDREENSVTYEEFYKSLEPLINNLNSNSSSTTDSNSFIQTYTSLPFITKSNSMGIYSIEEKEDKEKNLEVL